MEIVIIIGLLVVIFLLMLRIESLKNQDDDDDVDECPICTSKTFYDNQCDNCGYERQNY